MRRWNGWGEEGADVPLSSKRVELLEQLLGRGVIAPDATLEQVLASAQAPRPLEHGLLSSSPRERILHARGQSFPDWVALRSGRLGLLPDAVAHPTREEEVRALLDWARTREVSVITYGGGTSVTGHVNPVAGDRAVLTLALDRYGKLEHLDHESRLARFQPGARGPELERQLAEHGYRLGHYPQSFEYSTLGGWIATRSSGQQSFGYGRIEDLLAGCRVLTWSGALELPELPASAAGPDLKHWVLGSEGRLGVITGASVRVSPLPEREAFHAVLFSDWESAYRSVRALVDSSASLSMVRLSDADETASLFQLPSSAEQGLSLLGYGGDRCLMIFAASGSRRQVLVSVAEAYALCRAEHGLPVGPFIGNLWKKNRYKGPYLRNSLWDAGYAVDTLETAVPWRSVARVSREVKQALSEGLARYNERVLAFAHLSHVYRDGASVYFTFLFRRAEDPDALLERWQTLKRVASEAVVANGGTISHQHGVGVDHAPYLGAEKSELGMQLLRSALQTFDPKGQLNPGKLLT